MRVLKFGGSSVKDPESIRKVTSIIEQKSSSGENICAVVFSAFRGVTDTLEDAAGMAAAGDESYEKLIREVEERHISAVKSLLDVSGQSGVLTDVKMVLNELEDVLNGVYLVRELTPRTFDFVKGFGERFSAKIITAHLKEQGLTVEFLDTRTVIKTDDTFGTARVLHDESNRLIQKHFKEHEGIQIATGFIASTRSGNSTTLGRGGSDYTAALIGAALGVDNIEIWTDIEGIMTADPTKVKRHFPIPRLSYEEAMELSHFGAKVVYPPTMQPAMKAGIPIIIKNTFKPEKEGTTISSTSQEGASPIKGISSIDNITLITVRGSGMIGVTGVAARIFNSLASSGVNIILITQASSEHTVCLAVLPGQSATAKKAIEEEFRYEIRDEIIDEIKLEKDLSVVAIVGDDMRQTPGISGRLFQALGHNGINISAIAQGSSERNISVVVDRKNEAKALNTLHDAFFLSAVRTVNLFLVGVGLIGSTLLDLIRNQAQKLYEDYNIDLRLTGISNSKKYLVDEGGIDLNEWRNTLNKSNTPADIHKFISEMKELNLSNSIFVDCTASPEIAEVYSKVLKASVSIVTANKIANSSTLEQYEELQSLARKHNVSYLYETNVGAGLPVVATLKEQILTGDKIQKIEGVLSGTLSYIFNTFDGSQPFSSVVRTAMEKGYTEPDPREDLNGRDVGRKLLILARESGIRLQFGDIEIDNLVPVEARSADSVDRFFEELEEKNETYSELFNKARQESKKLCYIARYEDGKATVALESIGPKHPFYNITGSDNIVAFTTHHYRQSPLVVKGPGAGAGVTASGIVADILRIGNAPNFGLNF
jgi:aspartokinase/homoserine dehydrogenase 1